MTSGSARYEVRVRGQLGETIRTAFPGFCIHTRESDTVLSGTLADQAAVFRVLAAVESLGLELVEMRRMAPD
jgi:hypothetical protein